MYIAFKYYSGNVNRGVDQSVYLLGIYDTLDGFEEKFYEYMQQCKIKALKTFLDTKQKLCEFDGIEYHVSVATDEFMIHHGDYYDARLIKIEPNNDDIVGYRYNNCYIGIVERPVNKFISEELMSAFYVE